MDECNDSLTEAAVLSTPDANSCYRQVAVEETPRGRTAFTSHRGLYEFLRMHFGLYNTPRTFQLAMDVILSPGEWQFTLVYLDYIVVFSCSQRNHTINVKQISSLFVVAEVTLKLKQ